ncbi:uncharacterized protein KRP23_3373 [Phytophthora ramorum]|uniref:uncharacterized protein n=1 Tax=Phytophthora ramorum TaxID=164328 RepID=UPI0030976616|nr:hypothetical protein KRP23_3373 [Phytophthora ramorum]
MVNTGLIITLPKTLAACQCAVTLRKHVSTFFVDNDKTQRGHHHFLGLLRDWYSTLKGIGTDQQEETPRRRFDNYYVVLELDEDFFPDEGTFAVESGAPRSVRDERERLFNEAFAQDLRLEVVYFFLELGELVEGVAFRIYDQVKKQQRTMVEATVVAKLAMDTATALTARLQLRYQG